MAFNLNGFNFNQSVVDSQGRVINTCAGYNVEYSSMGFALFFLGEYANMILMSVYRTGEFC
jgi:NADH:ubiquinone oxidoreductase subunit H